EHEYVEREVSRQTARAAQQAASWTADLATQRPGTKRHRDVQYQATWWTEHAGKMAAGEPVTLERTRRNAGLTYLKLVKQAISTGKIVPAAVVAQSIEYRK